MARSAAGSSLGSGTFPAGFPSGASSWKRPVARASSSSLHTSMTGDSTSPMPARILGAATLNLLLPKPVGRLEPFLDGGDEARGVVSVDDAVVDGDREVHEVADHDRAVTHRRALRDLVDAEDRDLGVVDDGRGQDAAELAQAGDRE